MDIDIQKDATINLHTSQETTQTAFVFPGDWTFKTILQFRCWCMYPNENKIPKLKGCLLLYNWLRCVWAVWTIDVKILK